METAGRTRLGGDMQWSYWHMAPVQLGGGGTTKKFLPGSLPKFATKNDTFRRVMGGGGNSF